MAIDSEEIFAALPEARRKAIQARTDELIAEELTLAAIREARRRSQEAVAKKLGVQQPTVSKIERRTDMYLSTLRSYIAALGGELQIVAQFPDRGADSYHQFQTLKEEAHCKFYRRRRQPSERGYEVSALFAQSGYR